MFYNWFEVCFFQSTRYKYIKFQVIQRDSIVCVSSRSYVNCDTHKLMPLTGSYQRSPPPPCLGNLCCCLAALNLVEIKRWLLWNSAWKRMCLFDCQSIVLISAMLYKSICALYVCASVCVYSCCGYCVAYKLNFLQTLFALFFRYSNGVRFLL